MVDILSKTMDEVHAHLDIDIKALNCVVAQINLKENRGIISLKHWQQAQCRLLLLLCGIKEILVCPDPSFLEEILIVAPREILRNPSLDTILKESSLKLKNHTTELTPDILQAALQFSIVARLSPYWNAVVKSEATEGDVLISGTNFLMDSSDSPLDAVKLRVFAKGCKMWIGISACRLRLPIMRPEYLDISFHYIDKILSSSGPCCIDESKIGDPLVYVLPSLKKGIVTHLMNGLPLESDFQNYTHVQRHWRETFGLILTGEDPGHSRLLANVKLEGSSRSSVYPLQCLLRTSPVILKHDSPWSSVKSVLKKIKSFVQILLLEVNEGHFLDRNEKEKHRRIIEEGFDEGSEADVASNAGISKTDFKKPKKTASESGCYRLSLRRPLISDFQSTASKTDNPKLRTQCSKSLVVSLPVLTHTNPKKKKISADQPSSRASKSSRPKQKIPRGRKGKPLRPNESIERLFEMGALDRVNRVDLVRWLRNKKMSVSMNTSKMELVSRVRAALTNTSMNV